MRSHPLKGYRLLLVEDEYFIASDIFTLLEQAGATVLGPVSDVERATEIAEAAAPRFDVAILDVNLDGEHVFPAAHKLQAQHIPFIFVTGYDRLDMPAAFKDVPCLRKPFQDSSLIDGLCRLIDRCG